jgi:hypothetical protein
VQKITKAKQADSVAQEVEHKAQVQIPIQPTKSIKSTVSSGLNNTITHLELIDTCKTGHPNLQTA